MGNKKTIVLPLIGMGNVPQYAVQSVIDKKKYTKRSIIDSLYLYPFVGSDISIIQAKQDFNTEIGELTSPLELYENVGCDDYTDMLQLHSPIIPGCESLFVKQITDIINNGNYTHVVVLDSRDKGLWHGKSEIEGEIVEFEGGEGEGEGVIHWKNQTISNMDINKDEINTPQEDDHAIGNNTLLLLNEQLSPEAVEIDYYAVNVYEGENWKSIDLLLRKSGVQVL